MACRYVYTTLKLLQIHPAHLFPIFFLVGFSISEYFWDQFGADELEKQRRATKYYYKLKESK